MGETDHNVVTLRDDVLRNFTYPLVDFWKELDHDSFTVPHAPISANWQPLKGFVRHTFTHFHLELTIWVAKVGQRQRPLRGEFIASAQIADRALPSIMKKVQAYVYERWPHD